MKNFFVEPIGSAKPQLAKNLESFPIKSEQSSIALTCPAQGSPIPSFRLVRSVDLHYPL